MRSPILLLLFALLSFVIVSVHSVRFEVVPNVEKCIREEFRPDSLISGTAEAFPELNDMQMSLRVSTCSINNLASAFLLNTSL